jgi:alpha-L-rhamnosidase
MDILPEQYQIKAADYLNKNVERFKHITTGFLGTPLISQTLTDFGYLDTAYMLLNRKKYPSWLYPVTMGATTIWERWDGIKPDSTFQNPGMNSFNHYAYGAIGKWLYSTVAGIAIDEKNPGYKHIIIHPQPGGGLTRARADIKTMYGEATSGWNLKDGKVTMEITIPANTNASVYLPVDRYDTVKLDGQTIREQKFEVLEDENGRKYFTFGSGSYTLEYTQ